MSKLLPNSTLLGEVAVMVEWTTTVTIENGEWVTKHVPIQQTWVSVYVDHDNRNLWLWFPQCFFEGVEGLPFEELSEIIDPSLFRSDMRKLLRVRLEIKTGAIFTNEASEVLLRLPVLFNDSRGLFQQTIKKALLLYQSCQQDMSEACR